MVKDRLNTVHSYVRIVYWRIAAGARSRGSTDVINALVATIWRQQMMATFTASMEHARLICVMTVNNLAQDPAINVPLDTQLMIMEVSVLTLSARMTSVSSAAS